MDYSKYYKDSYDAEGNKTGTLWISGGITLICAIAALLVYMTTGGVEIKPEHADVERNVLHESGMKSISDTYASFLNNPDSITSITLKTYFSDVRDKSLRDLDAMGEVTTKIPKSPWWVALAGVSGVSLIVFLLTLFSVSHVYQSFLDVRRRKLKRLDGLMDGDKQKLKRFMDWEKRNTEIMDRYES